MTLRSVVERSLGSVIFKKKIPNNLGGGFLYVSGRAAGMKYLIKPIELVDKELIRIAKIFIKNGDTVWDVGANIGLFSKIASFLTGRDGLILAIEADVDLVKMLNKSFVMEYSNYGDIVIISTALGNHEGYVNFSISKRARASNSIAGYGSNETGGVYETRSVTISTLDTLLGGYRPPNFLKIDVEGAELEVLNGGKNLLTEVRPVIYCEVFKKYSADVTALFNSYSYELWDGSSFISTSQKRISSCTHNTVAIPSEKVGLYE